MPFRPLDEALQPSRRSQPDLKEPNTAEPGSGATETRARKRGRANDDSGIENLEKVGKSMSVIDIHETT